MALLNFKEILELIDKVSESGLGAVEVETSGVRLRIEGKPSDQIVVHESAPATLVPTIAAPQPSAQTTPAAGQTSADEEPDEDLHIITSPIVGTFYSSASPEADPYVKVGDHVSKGAVLCIVEAMKLMNEIEADVEGTITKIYPQNGQPIEYGEKLFDVRLG